MCHRRLAAGEESAMSTRGRVSISATLVLVLSLSSAVTTVRGLDRVRHAGSEEDVLLLPSATVIKRLSLGYTGLAADLYWTRAVQYFGAMHHAHARSFPLLAPLLGITTELDPHLMVAYEF